MGEVKRGDRLLTEVDEVISFFERYGDCWRDGLPPLMRRIRERLAVRQAATDVLSERRRQVEAEGWTAEHDDCHGTGELAEAAACYAFYARYQPAVHPDLWPWDGQSWKPKDQRTNLVKAGALILAEIERLDRISKAESSHGA